MDSMFYDSPEDCCRGYFGRRCKVVDDCITGDQGPLDPTEQPINSPTTSPTPEPTLEPTPNPSAPFNSASTEIDDQTEGTEFVNLVSGSDDFEGNDRLAASLPWILGNPPQWTIDDTVVYSGTKSIRNFPVTGIGATSDLTLKVTMPDVAVMKCQAKVDVSMPFDMFTLLVNGEQRNSYFQPIENWFLLATGLGQGCMLNSGRQGSTSHSNPPGGRCPLPLTRFQGRW